MRVVAWNIQGGGGKRLGAVADEFISRDADVYVVGEYIRGRSERLAATLADAGWSHAELPDPPERYGGVAVISRFPLERLDAPSGMGSQAAYRHIGVSIPAAHVQVHGVYGPLHADPYVQFWDALLDNLRRSADGPVLVLGDFNTGIAGVDNTTSTLFCSKYFARIPEAGYTDLWRAANGAEAREYTWQCVNRGQAFPHRLDHAFGSAAMAERLRDCSYDHRVREAKLSDHSLLTVDLADAAPVAHSPRDVDEEHGREA